MFPSWLWVTQNIESTLLRRLKSSSPIRASIFTVLDGEGAVWRKKRGRSFSFLKSKATNFFFEKLANALKIEQ